MGHGLWLWAMGLGHGRWAPAQNHSPPVPFQKAPTGEQMAIFACFATANPSDTVQASLGFRPSRSLEPWARLERAYGL